MKLHTLDQIDPLILKLERAVKQNAAAQEPDVKMPTLGGENKPKWTAGATESEPVAAAPDAEQPEFKSGEWYEGSMDGANWFKRQYLRCDDQYYWFDEGMGSESGWRYIRHLPAPPSSLKAGDWIEWKGGACPLGENIKVECKFRGHILGTPLTVSHHLDWSHTNVNGDIIAYRLVNP